MNKENSAPARLFPTDDEAGEGPIGGGGIKVPGVVVTWLYTSPQAVYLITNGAQNPTWKSGGDGRRGRWKIEYTPQTGVKAFKWWVEDETADANNTTGYQFFNSPTGQYDGNPPTAPRSIDISASTFLPPYKLYVSSLRHEKKVLKIQPYPGWTAGAPSGTPLTTLSIPLSTPSKPSAVVTMESPDGYFSTRWRRVSFSADPIDWPLLRGSQVFTSDILTTTRVRSQNFVWPTPTYKYNGDPRNSMYLVRLVARDGGVAPTAWHGQHQFRRIVEAGQHSGFNGYIEYERPFDPPLANNETCWIVDKCFMVRVHESPVYAVDEPPEWTPVIGELYLDTWGLQDERYQPVTTWSKRFFVEYYYHDANYGPYGNSGYSYTYQQKNAPRDESDIEQIAIRAPGAPYIRTLRLMESMINSGKLRVEIKDTVGDVARWRLYVKATDWPTHLAGSERAQVDEAYFIGEYSRYERFAETTFDISANSAYAIVVPLTVDGERSIITHKVRTAAPETLPILYNLKVVPEDASSTQPKHRITWSSNGAAQDALYGFRIECHKKEHEGMSNGENPTRVLWSGTNLAVTGTFLHDGVTDAVSIDQRGSNTQYRGDDRTVTHIYELVLLGSSGTELTRARVEFTDRYTTAPEAAVSLGQAWATLRQGSGVLDSAGRVIEPVTIDVAYFPKNAHYVGHVTSNSVSVYIEYSIDGLTNTDGAKVWYPLSTRPNRRMHTPRHAHLNAHRIWGKQIVASGGTVYPLVYRVYWKQASDSYSARRGTVYSNVLSLRLADIAAPGPF